MSTSRCLAHSGWLIPRGGGCEGGEGGTVIVKCVKARGPVVCVRACVSQGFSQKYFKASRRKNKEKMDIRIWSSGPRWGTVGESPPPTSLFFPSYNRNESVWSPPPLIPLFSLLGNLHPPPPPLRCSSTGELQRLTNTRGWIDTVDMCTPVTCKMLDSTRECQLICSIFNTPSPFNEHHWRNAHGISIQVHKPNCLSL